jgi:FkbM family methyltransferase
MFSRWVTTFKRRVFRHTGLALFHEWELNGVRLDLTGIGPVMKQAIVLGQYERAETAACRAMIRPGDQILELGGAVGYVGLFCLTQCGASRVTSVEANPNTLTLLRNNYVLNARREEVIEAAVTADDGPVTFHLSADLWQDGLSARDTTQGTVQVPGLSLPSVLARLSFQPTALFADIEGGETALDWSALPASVDRILIELHPRLSGPQAAFALLHRWMGQGFEVVFFQDDVFGLQRVSCR